jgi:hypothetical protein
MSASCVANAKAEALELIATSMSEPLKAVSSASISARFFSTKLPKIGEVRVLVA